MSRWNDPAIRERARQRAGTPQDTRAADRAAAVESIAAIRARAQEQIRCDVCKYLLLTHCCCPGGPRGDDAA